MSVTGFAALTESLPVIPSPFQLAVTTQAKFWREPVVYLDDPVSEHWTLAADLFDDAAAIDAMLAHQQSFTPDLDVKGQAAYAIGDYSYMFAIVAVAPLVGFGLLPDLSPRNYALRFPTILVEHRGRMVEGRSTHVRFMDTRVLTDDPTFKAHSETLALVDRPTLLERFREQAEAHFAPLVGVLSARSRLSRNALWRLVGDSLSQLFLDAGRRFGRIEAAKSAAMAVLKHKGSPLTNRQMHYFDIDVRDENDPGGVMLSVTYRARGGCCRFYTVEGGHLCTTCVLQDPAERSALLEARLRKRVGLSGRRLESIANPDVAV